MPRELSVLLSGSDFLECPRWHDGRVWVSDFYRHEVLAVGLDGTAEVVAEVPGQPAGLGWLPDGRLLVVSMRDRRVLRREPSGELVQHADLAGVADGHANDMVVAADGRAWVGNFGFDLMAGADVRPARLALVTPDGAVRAVADDLYSPNGSVLLADGTLVVAETLAQRLTAFDVAPDGTLTGRRVWAAFGPAPTGPALGAVLGGLQVAPDGICADAEGAVWVADGLGHRVLRVREGGEVVDEVDTGDLTAYACALAGEDGRTLVLCAAPSFLEHERTGRGESVLMTCRVEVARAPEA